MAVILIRTCHLCFLHSFRFAVIGCLSLSSSSWLPRDTLQGPFAPSLLSCLFPSIPFPKHSLYLRNHLTTISKLTTTLHFANEFPESKFGHLVEFCRVLFFVPSLCRPRNRWLPHQEVAKNDTDKTGESPSQATIHLQHPSLSNLSSSYSISTTSVSPAAYHQPKTEQSRTNCYDCSFLCIVQFASKSPEVSHNHEHYC